MAISITIDQYIKEIEHKVVKDISDKYTRDTIYNTSFMDIERYYREIVLNEDITIGFVEMSTAKRLEITHNNPESGIEMHLNLNGEAWSPYGGNKQHFKENEHNLLFTPHFHESIIYEPTKSFSSVEISFSVEFIKNITDGYDLLQFPLEAIENNKMSTLGCNRKIGSLMKCIIYSLLNCNYTGFSKKIFLESKVLELLSIQLNEFEIKEQTINRLNKIEIEKLEIVKNHIENNYNKNLSLLELGKLVGLNINKLKSGFKTIYKHTVFEYIYELRMNYGLKMLKESNIPIAEIADLCGYKNPQHFTVAFKKRFQVLPKDIRK